jgi:hypothetical protein
VIRDWSAPRDQTEIFCGSLDREKDRMVLNFGRNRVPSEHRFGNARDRIVLFFAAGAAVLYILVVAFQPISILPLSVHDDAHFIALGRSLAEGKWLGNFSQFTLMKGPGYPLFLAVNFWLGVPVTLAHAGFFCFALAIFCWAVSKICQSCILGVVLFISTLWHPAFLGTRILRDAIYTGQLFLLFGCALVAFLIAGDRWSRTVWGSLAGLALGWFWLTREEGIWVLPAAVFFLVALFITVKKRGTAIRDIGTPLVFLLLAFALSNLAFSSANWVAYGSFIGVDNKERNFVAALSVLQSVNHGSQTDYVPVPRAARESIYAVSPAFASLAPYLDPPEGAVWQFGCQYYPSTCGDIAGGWFIWALRDAASRAGHYRSPVEASRFFGQLANEVGEACRAGRLACRGFMVPYMPYMSWSQLKRFPERFGHAIALIAHPANLISDGYPSDGGGSRQLADALAVLNDPPYNPPSELSEHLALRGWYYSKDGIWPTFTLERPNGQPAPMAYRRIASLDIASGFQDARAVQNRFAIDAYCDPDCILSIKRGDGTVLRPRLSSLFSVGPTSGGGDGTFYVEGSDTERDPAGSDIRLHLSKTIRRGVLAIYNSLLPYALCLGALAFIAAATLAFAGRSGGALVSIAATVWILLASRVALLVLIDLSAFSTLDDMWYLMSPLYLSVTAVILSIASLLFGLQDGPGSFLTGSRLTKN